MRGDSFAVGLGAVAGACVDHRSGQTRMPPQERQHEGLGGIGGFFCGWTGSRCGSGRLTTGWPVDHSGQPRKVARGRSWQPEIGMEHASRGRRSGNKGVGARWRGRFRIFSARHCSRTKVSHAENSGMTMLFFLWRLLRCRRGILSHARERQHQELRGWGVLCGKMEFCAIIRAISTHPPTHPPSLPPHPRAFQESKAKNDAKDPPIVV